MRPVEYFHYDYKNRKPNEAAPLVKDGEAVFHQFGIEYEEFELGPGQFTTAVIELPDGTIKNMPVELVRFIDKEPF